MTKTVGVERESEGEREREGERGVEREISCVACGSVRGAYWGSFAVVC